MHDPTPGASSAASAPAPAHGSPVSIAQTLHRIDPSVVVSAAQSAGFKMLGRSEVLANPADDRRAMVFDATIRRHTDQFLFKFQKKS